MSSDAAEDRRSSIRLPLDMTEQQFGAFSAYLLSELSGKPFLLTQLLGVGAGGVTSAPPEFVSVKGSSVTGVSFAAGKEQKTFHPGSDYDCALSWQEALKASEILANVLRLIRRLLDDLSSDQKDFHPKMKIRLQNLISKIGPNKDNRLQLHNSDKLYLAAMMDQAHEIPRIPLEMVYSFPTGQDHFRFCQQAQHQVLRSSHDINFIINPHPSDLTAHLYPVELVSASPTSMGVVRDLSPVLAAVQTVLTTAETQSEEVSGFFPPHYGPDESKLMHNLRAIDAQPLPPVGSVLVYTWDLITDAAKKHSDGVLTHAEEAPGAVNGCDAAAAKPKKLSKKELRKLKLKKLREQTAEVETDAATAAAEPASNHLLIHYLNQTVSEIFKTILAQIEEMEHYIFSASKTLMELFARVHDETMSGTMSAEDRDAFLSAESRPLVLRKPILLDKRRLTDLRKFIKNVRAIQPNSNADSNVIGLLNAIDSNIHSFLKSRSYESYHHLETRLQSGLAAQASPVSVISFLAKSPVVELACSSPKPEERRSSPAPRGGYSSPAPRGGYSSPAPR